MACLSFSLCPKTTRAPQPKGCGTFHSNNDFFTFPWSNTL